jgi:hypothetical protein
MSPEVRLVRQNGLYGVLLLVIRTACTSQLCTSSFRRCIHATVRGLWFWNLQILFCANTIISRRFALQCTARRQLTPLLVWPHVLQLLLHGRASRASDVYAYGILLWDLATGQRAFAGTVQALGQTR